MARFSFQNLRGKPRAEEEKPEDEETTGEEETDEEKDTAEGDDEPKDEAEDGDSEDEAEGGSDDEEKDSAKAGVRLGVKRERARWATVLASKAAVGRVESACHMLANTGMTANTIIGTLKTLPQGKTQNGFDRAMRQAGNPNLGADGDASVSASNLSESDKRLVQFSKTVQQARKRA